MVSSNFCSYCYCFAGKRICVNPKCQLPNSKCRPLYAEGSCCPVHYDCSANSTSVSEKSNSNALIQSNSVQNRNYLRKTKLPENKGKCYAKGVSYFDGQKLPKDTNRPCEMCFCIRGNVMCTPKKCAPYIGNCKPLIPEGECCAVGYECRTKTNETTRHFRQDTGDEFDLFALLFGDDKPKATTNSPVATMVESSTGSQTDNDSETTTAEILREKGFFELLRDGLSMLDNSEEEQNDTEREQEELFNSTMMEERSTTELPSTNIIEEMQRVELLTPSTSKPSATVGILLKTSNSPVSSTVKIQEETTVKSSIVRTSSVSSSSTLRTSTEPSSTTVQKLSSTSPTVTTESNDITETTVDASLTSVQPNDDQTEIIGTEIHINTVPNQVQPSSTPSTTQSSTTTTPIFTTSSIMPFKPLNYGNSSNFLSAFLNMFDLGKTTSGTKAPLSFKPTPAPVPNDVKINPLIVEPQYNFDYDAPTLPPSLPNLRIIPFVPDDAVELRTEDLAKYPSITEETSIDRYDDLEKEHGQDLATQEKHEYSFDYDHVGEIPVQGGWGDYYTNYRPLNYDKKPDRNGIDRFSPPMQTEGRLSLLKVFKAN